MADPEGLKTTVLHGKYIQPDALGTPNAGSVTFTPNPAVIIFPDQNVLVMGQQTATLDVNGEFTIELISTDTANENPSGWLYSVTERIIGQKQNSYNIALPYNAGITVELSDITPTSVAPSYIPVVGPQGAPGIIQTINGHSAISVTLTAADVNAVATSAVGVASGVAPLDSSVKVPLANLYAGTANGLATLGATSKVPVAQIPDLSATYVPWTNVAAANGVASLDATTKVPSAQLNIASVAPAAIAAAGAVGISTNLARQDHTHAGLTQAATDARYPQKINLPLNSADYGFVGDGTTDNASAFAAFLAGVGAGGGKLNLLPGKYLINSGTGLTMSVAGTMIEGSGQENTQILIGSGFTGAQLFNITAANCTITDLTIQGNSITTTSNPVANGIEINGQRRTKITRVNFWYINGYTISMDATTASSTTNPLGTQLSQIFANSCAGGLHFKGNTTQSWAMNCQVSDFQFYVGGVTTGASANLDGILIEDAWDVLINDPIVWVSNGTGSSLHIKGNCAASFLTKVDFLGPSTGACVLIEDSVNGSPQNVQIDGGVIQQGSPGLSITGGANQIHISARIINNYTHGITVAGTAGPIHLWNCFYSGNGTSATGTIYDLNWSGAATGRCTNNTFSTALVASGTAGVQTSVNIAAAQAVTFENTVFRGTGAAAGNKMTNVPAGWLDTSDGSYIYTAAIKINAGSGTSLGITAGSTGQRLFGTTAIATDTTAIAHGAGVSGETFDRIRILVDGTFQVGKGSTARDLTMGYANAAGWYITPNLVVGGSAQLGDNGVGEIQLKDITTVPTTNPTAGTVIYSSSGTVIPLRIRDTNGNVRGMMKGYAHATADQTSVSTTQTASTSLVIAAEANATYRVDAWVYWTTASSATVTTSWTGPTGATMIWGDTTAGGDVVTTLTGVSPAWTTGNKLVRLFGLLTTTTAGNLTFTFASSVAASVTVKAGSYLFLERMS